MYRATAHCWGPFLCLVVVAVVATNVGFVLQALFPAVQGFGQGGASNLNIHPGAAETERHALVETEPFHPDSCSCKD